MQIFVCLCFRKQAQIDHMKPIFVPFGTDSMESIGLPPLSNAELNDPNHKSLLDIWKTLFCKYYPQEVIKYLNYFILINNIFLTN